MLLTQHRHKFIQYINVISEGKKQIKIIYYSSLQFTVIYMLHVKGK